MPQINPADLLPQALTIARKAGAAIMEIYVQDFAVEHKADDSPLTAADLAAHRCIAAGLKELAPDIPLLSEEGRDIPYEERKQWDTFWLIDPLDGTKEFIKKNGEFTVNIALIKHGKPILGVVHCPALQIDYYAAQGAGAFRATDQQAATAISTCKTGTEPRIVGSRSHRTPELEAFHDKLGPHDSVSKGSSLKFCMVAEAAADFYPRLGPTSEWDTAAGQCVVEQAGGIVVKTDFSPLTYNQRETLLNPHFLVIGDTDYNWQQYFGE